MTSIMQQDRENRQQSLVETLLNKNEIRRGSEIIIPPVSSRVSLVIKPYLNRWKTKNKVDRTTYQLLVEEEVTSKQTLIKKPISTVLDRTRRPTKTRTCFIKTLEKKCHHQVIKLPIFLILSHPNINTMLILRNLKLNRDQLRNTTAELDTFGSKDFVERTRAIIRVKITMVTLTMMKLIE